MKSSWIDDLGTPEEELVNYEGVLARLKAKLKSEGMTDEEIEAKKLVRIYTTLVADLRMLVVK